MVGRVIDAGEAGTIEALLCELARTMVQRDVLADATARLRIVAIAAGKHLVALGPCEDIEDWDGEDSCCSDFACTYCELNRLVSELPHKDMHP